MFSYVKNFVIATVAISSTIVCAASDLSPVPQELLLNTAGGRCGEMLQVLTARSKGGPSDLTSSDETLEALGSNSARDGGHWGAQVDVKSISENDYSKCAKTAIEKVHGSYPSTLGHLAILSTRLEKSNRSSSYRKLSFVARDKNGIVYDGSATLQFFESCGVEELEQLSCYVGGERLGKASTVYVLNSRVSGVPDHSLSNKDAGY